MLPVLAFCFDFVMSIPVFTMDPSVIPDDNATAEILNTDTLHTLNAVTICGRFRTPLLPNMLDMIQNLVYIKDMWLLFLFDMKNCDRFEGCTKFYQDRLGIFRKKLL